MCQFNQHFMSLSSYESAFFCQNVREKLREALSYEKRARKMLMK